MISRVFATTAVAASFLAVSAQLSQSCQSSLQTIAGNQDAAACIAPGALVGLAAGNGTSSIVDPINSWLGSVCSAAPCSNSTLAFIVNTATSGCSQELSLLGYDSSQNSAIIQQVQTYYPTVRKVVCLKDGNTNCITQTLNTVQNAVGTLTVQNIINIASNSTAQDALMKANVTCSNCVKAAYNTIVTDIPSIANDIKSDAQSQCGSGFVDGQQPSGISESATTSGGKNGAILSAASQSGLYGFLTIGSLFALIA